MPKTIRHDRRRPDQLRPISFTPGIAPHAAGSVLARCGRTQVICAVTVEESVPRWMKEQQVAGGWITAEYSMLPYSTLGRKPRDITKGRLDGRSTEIQRLIGRSVRAAVDLEALGPRTLCIDCDVLAADGGTRTTAITGTYVALELAVRQLRKKGLLPNTGRSPIKTPFAAISVGIVEGRPLLDLDYIEDKDAQTDMNVVMTARGQFIEIQASGEESTFSPREFSALLALAAKGVKKIDGLAKGGAPVDLFPAGAAMPGKRIFIRSSELRWVRFEPERRVLTVEFVAGGIYEYHRMPKAKFEALLAAESRGRYFNANIRGAPSVRPYFLIASPLKRDNF